MRSMEIAKKEMLLRAEERYSAVGYHMDGAYAELVNRYLKKGDKVIIAIPASNSGSLSNDILRFQVGTVIFSNRFFATVETECREPDSGKVITANYDGTGAHKLRYTVDSTDIVTGAVKKCKKSDIFGYAAPESGFNTLQLNSMLRRGENIRKSGIHSACAVFASNGV